MSAMLVSSSLPSRLVDVAGFLDMSQQTWTRFSPTTVPNNNRQSGFSPTTVLEMSTGVGSNTRYNTRAFGGLVA